MPALATHAPLSQPANVTTPGPAVGQPVRRRSSRGLPLDVIADQFDELDADGQLLVDGRAICGLPGRPLGVWETRDLLLNPATVFDVRDRVFGWLLGKLHSADAGDPTGWNVVLAGWLLPGLRTTLTPVCRRHPRLRAEIELEALIGVWTAASRPSCRLGRPAAQLIWAARRAADEFVAADCVLPRITPGVAVGDMSSFNAAAVLRPAPGHPDLVLAAAVEAGVLTAGDALLIGATRLDEVELCTAAARSGLSYAAARQRRARAEACLVAWIREQF